MPVHSTSVPFSSILMGLVLWVPFIIFLLPTMVVICLLITYKWMVLFLRKLLYRQDLIRCVSGLDVMFSTDNFFVRPHGSLGFIWFLEGRISAEVVRSRLQSALFASSSINNNSTNGFEKLTSVYPTFWMGLPFWKKTRTKFDITNHVKVMMVNRPTSPNHSPKFIMHLVGMNKLICEWMSEPFQEGKPLWEVRVVPQITILESSLENLLDCDRDYVASSCTTSKGLQKDAEIKQSEVGVESSILILKTHHILGDGNSMLRLLDKIIDSPEDSFSSESFMKSKNTLDIENLKVEEKLQRQQTNRTVKINNRTDQQGAYCKVKSLNVTSTYGSKDNASDAVNRYVESEEGKHFGGEDLSNSWRRWIRSKLRLLWRQLSNTIYFTFFIPTSIYALLYEFAVHRDFWFTQKKSSDKVNLATVSIPLKKLNAIRKDLCERQTESLSGTGDADANEEGNRCRVDTLSKVGRVVGKTSSLVPVIVMAVGALAGALQRFMSCHGKLEDMMDRGTQSHELTYDMGRSRNDESQFSLSCPKTFSPSLGNSRSFVNFVIAIPLEKEHPGSRKFCNFWTHGILKANLSEPNSLRRIHQLSNSYWEMKVEQRPEIYHSLIKLYSLLPKPILLLISSYNVGASIGVTNMADSSKAVFVGGRKVYRKYGYFGLQWEHASLTLTLLSYNGDMTATILANESVVPDQTSVEKLLCRYFMNEIEFTSRSASESSTGTPEPSSGRNSE